MKKIKAICYACPTSTNGGQSGGWYVETRKPGKPGKMATTLFNGPDSPELIAAFHATPGDICPFFAQNGNPKARAAITQ